MGLHTSLEEVERCGSRSISRHILTGSILDDGHLADEGHDVAEELHQAADTHVTACADAEHGEDAACHESLADTLTHFILRKVFGLEELLHECVVTGGGGLNKCSLHLLGLV